MRDLWRTDNVENKGIYLRFSKGVDKELREIIMLFVYWLRCNYNFPVKLMVYIKDTPYIVNHLTNEKASASIFLPDDRTQSPRARIAAGDYYGLVAKMGEFSASCSVLASIAHEITHYYQWLKDETGEGELCEKQARRKSKNIVNKYLDCFIKFNETADGGLRSP